MYKLFLTLRYLHKLRIALFAVVSVWLCVAMVVIVISVMGGFLETLKERSRGLLSDIVIDNSSLQGFPYYEEFIERISKNLPDTVQTATPVIYNYGIIRVGSTSFTKTVQVVGIRLQQYVQVNDFGNSLFYEKYYPGTTSLGMQKLPMVGFDDNGVARLPPKEEEAFREYRRLNPDAEESERFSGRAGARVRTPGLFKESFDRPPGYYDDEAAGIIIGCNIINDRTRSGDYVRIHPRGTKIILSLLPLTRGGKIGGEGATTVVMRMSDDSRTRVFEIDDKCCYVDFHMLQTWLSMTRTELEDGGFASARASQVLVSLHEGVDIHEGRDRIEDEWHRFLASLEPRLSPQDAQFLSWVSIETWEERQVQFILAVEKEKILVTVLFGVISMVAVVLIGCIFWMIVTQKTRDIGIVKSVGGSPAGITVIFVAFGAAVGIVGGLLGVGTGTLFVWYINDIQDALVAINPQLRVWSPDVYTFDRIPNMVQPFEVVSIFCVAVGASMMGALIPAVLAGRVWPVEALRYE